MRNKKKATELHEQNRQQNIKNNKTNKTTTPNRERGGPATPRGGGELVDVGGGEAEAGEVVV